MIYRQSNFCTYSIKRSLFKINSVDPAIFGTQYGTLYGALWDILGRPGCPKVVSIKIFTVSRDRFGLPDRNFSIQAIAVVSVVFPYNRPGRLDVI